MHISLTDALDKYVRDQVATGLYNNASEVIREALRLKIAADKREEAKLASLRAAIDEGEASLERDGAIPWTPDLQDRIADEAGLNGRTAAE